MLKNKIWLFHIPSVVLFTAFFLISELGLRGELDSKFLREDVYPFLRNLSSPFTDLKFKIRGHEKFKNKIVVVEVDSPSLEQLGRWPWHRDVMSIVVDQAFQEGAKVVGLDIVFSEEDRRVSPELQDFLESQKLGDVSQKFETDFYMAEMIQKHQGKLVLGWMSELTCQPKFSDPQNCPIQDPEFRKKHPHPAGFEKFSVSEAEVKNNITQSPLVWVLDAIANIDLFNLFATHSGYLQAFPDPDGRIRRSSLLMVLDGKFYPSLPLSMAQIGKQDEIEVDLGTEEKIKSIHWKKTKEKIPTSPLGVLDINFRGPPKTTPYVSVLDLLNTELEEIPVYFHDQSIQKMKRADLFQDAYVLIGVTAIGVYDMRSFPFASFGPGVDGHAAILDNLLSNDSLQSSYESIGEKVILFLMTLGALLFAFFSERLTALKALSVYLLAFLGVASVDVFYLFSQRIHWDTSFLYLELLFIFVLTVAIKYVLEEKNKKFIKGAFSKYVSPSIVDSILEDPTKLTVGGEKKEITILFSDIRGFTTFSEKLDPKALSTFLNDYLGMMTDLIFDNDGTLDKYIGDAVMSFWGAPLNIPKHAHLGVKTAREMIQKLNQEKERFLKDYGIQVDIGIGLNTGAVSVGNMGSERIFEYTVIGDHVNLASRMEGLTKPYGSSILTSRYTIDSIKESGETPPLHRTLDFVKVKGKKQAVEIIQILDQDLDKEGLELFHGARELYQKQNWDLAIAQFKQANLLLSGNSEKTDLPCQMYIERCEEFKKNPPEPDWDGSWEMTSK